MKSHVTTTRPNMTDMDGRVLRRGDRAVCLSLPRTQPCLVQVLGIEDDGSILVTNGRLRVAVDPLSCISQAAT